MGSRPGAVVGGTGIGLTFGTGEVAVCVNWGFIAAVSLIVFAAVGVSVVSAATGAGVVAIGCGTGIGLTFGTGEVAVCVCNGFIAAVNLIVLAAVETSAEAVVSCPADTFGIREPGVPTGMEREGRAIFTVASSEASFAVAGAGIGAGAGVASVIFIVGAAAKASTVAAGIATVGRFVTAGAGVSAAGA